MSCDACQSAHYLTDTLDGKRESRLNRRSGDDRRCVQDEEGSDNACCECPSTAVCEEQTSIETMLIPSGYYRHSAMSPRLWKCPDERSCPGELAWRARYGKREERKMVMRWMNETNETTAESTDARYCGRTDDGEVAYFGPLCR